MNKNDNSVLTQDYIKIRGREIFSRIKGLLDSHYEALASLGQKDAIVKYLEIKIDNNNSSILPEIASIIDKMDEKECLINAYCKTLKSYLENIKNINEQIKEINNNFTIFNTKGKMPITNMNLLQILQNTQYNNEEQKLGIKISQAENNYKYNLKLFKNNKFMSILTTAIEKYSATLSKQNLKPEIQEIEIEPAFLDMTAYAKIYKIDLPELYLYTHILERIDNLPGVQLFADTKRKHKLEKYIVDAITQFNYNIYPTITESATVADLVNLGKVKAGKVLKNTAKDFAYQQSSLQYSQELSEALRTYSKFIKSNHYTPVSNVTETL